MANQPRPAHEPQAKSNKSDQAPPESAAGRDESGAENQAMSDFEAEVHDHEGGARPMSEITGGPQGGTPDEDEDGLNEVERALREAAEAPVGRREIDE